MIRRLCYLLFGALLGGYTVYRLTRTARAWHPEQIAGRVERRLSGYRSAVRELGSDVHDAMEHRETELRRLHGVQGSPQPEPGAVEVGDWPRR